MQCNIDAKGKFVRLIWGLVLFAGAGVWAGLILADGVAGGWGWIGVVVLTLFGALGVYEARAGWCVVRAMGMKTKW